MLHNFTSSSSINMFYKWWVPCHPKFWCLLSCGPTIILAIAFCLCGASQEVTLPLHWPDSIIITWFIQKALKVVSSPLCATKTNTMTLVEILGLAQDWKVYPKHMHSYCLYFIKLIKNQGSKRNWLIKAHQELISVLEGSRSLSIFCNN